MTDLSDNWSVHSSIVPSTQTIKYLRVSLLRGYFFSCRRRNPFCLSERDQNGENKFYAPTWCRLHDWLHTLCGKHLHYNRESISASPQANFNKADSRSCSVKIPTKGVFRRSFLIRGLSSNSACRKTSGLPKCSKILVQVR